LRIFAGCTKTEVFEIQEWIERILRKRAFSKNDWNTTERLVL